MNDFVKLLGRQLARDARRLPTTARDRLSQVARAERYGTIGELRVGAREALPRVIFDFVDGAAGDEVTAVRNRTDFAALELLPRSMVDVSKIDLRTAVIGQPIDVPLLGAPMGLLGMVHPDGEVAVARGLHSVGSVSILSAMASHTLEEVAERAPGPLWFQLYVWRDRGLVRELAERARAAGYRALVLTVDVPYAAARDRDRRNGFALPPRATARSLAAGLRHPRWSYNFVRYPRMTAANVAGHGGSSADPISITEYINAQFDPSLSWDDLGWFRELYGGPLVVKGILRPEDARRAVDLGADAVIVSNHGGRQLDHAASTIAMLPSIVETVGSDAEVYLDGGVRRGSDVLKALAAGARACVVGRPLVYGLGVAGEAGAARAAAILREELRRAMGLAGCPSVQSADPTLLRRRDGDQPHAGRLPSGETSARGAPEGATV